MIQRLMCCILKMITEAAQRHIYNILPMSCSIFLLLILTSYDCIVDLTQIWRISFVNYNGKYAKKWTNNQGFFPGGDWGVPPSGENFANPPTWHLSPLLNQGLSLPPPPPAEVRPRKFEKFKYIFVSNMTTFKVKSTLKSCISCLK